MIRNLIPALLFAAGSALGANESLIKIDWQAGGSFGHAGPIGPGNFLEVCGKLPKGDGVRWQFESDVELAFNIHYHQGQDVVYPAKLPPVKQGQGELKAPVEQDYCWMWSNKGQQQAVIKLKLQR